MTLNKAMMALTLSLAGVLIHYYELPDALSFALWLASGLGMIILMQNAQVLWRFLPERMRRVRTEAAPGDFGPCRPPAPPTYGSAIGPSGARRSPCATAATSGRPRRRHR